MRGFRLLDEVGTRVGRVEEVHDDWLLVRLGRVADVFTLVPRHEAVVAKSHVWVPYRFERMLRAVPLARGGLQSERIERELRMHYGLLAGTHAVVGVKP